MFQLLKYEFVFETECSLIYLGVLQPLSLNRKGIFWYFVFHKMQIACRWVSLCLNASVYDKDIELRTLGEVLGDDITSLFVGSEWEFMVVLYGTVEFSWLLGKTCFPVMC